MTRHAWDCAASGTHHGGGTGLQKVRYFLWW
jgi:hypothetical protein